MRKLGARVCLVLLGIVLLALWPLYLVWKVLQAFVCATSVPEAFVCACGAVSEIVSDIVWLMRDPFGDKRRAY